MRISALNSLASCARFAMIESDEVSGAAADNGSALGRLCELWHNGIEYGSAIRQVTWEAKAGSFPRADMDLVDKWGWQYASDSRNAVGSPVGDYVSGSGELEVRFKLGRHELVGHVDQLRSLYGQKTVWDIKTGRAEGRAMVYSYAWQLAAYALAATETLGEPVLPGGIIRIRGYVARGKKDPSERSVFFYAPWTLDGCREMLESAESILDSIEDGKSVLATPGAHCGYCPAGDPTSCKGFK